MPTVRWSCWSGDADSVAFVVSLLVCALSRASLSEFLAVIQELILLAATVKLLLLCSQSFLPTVLLLLLVVFLELVDFDTTAMPLGLELISAFVANMTLLLLELPLSVVPLLLLPDCEVNVRWRRQVVVWIWLSLIFRM